MINMKPMRCYWIVANLFAGILCAQEGALDPTFGNGGRVLGNFGKGNERLNAVVVEPDGKFLSGGRAEFMPSFWSSFLLMRHNPDGSLDATFGEDGIVGTMINAGDSYNLYGSSTTDSEIADLVLLSDGRILAVGHSFTSVSGSGLNRLAMARYNADGTLDNTFGMNGHVVNLDVYCIDAYAGLLSDGRIVVAASGYGSLKLLRYNADGTLDISFDGDGLVELDPGLAFVECRGLTVDASDRITLAGSGFSGIDVDLFLMRVLADGSADTSFNGTGTVTASPGIGNDLLQDMMLEDDGVVVGVQSVLLDVPVFVLQRFLEDGTPDPAFGTTGTASFTPGTYGGELTGIARAIDGSYLATGKLNDVGSQMAMVTRFTASGQPDATYGNSGICTFPIAPDRLDPRAVCVDVAGRAMLVGPVSLGSINWQFDAGVACATPGGVPDPNFSDDGHEVIDTGIGGDFGMAVARQDDGKLVVAARTSSGMVVARYLVDGSLDPTFGANGHVEVSTYSPLSVSLQPDGKILVGTDGVFGLLRLNSDGSPDLTFNGGVPVVISDLLVSNYGAVHSILVQPDDRIVAVGYAYTISPLNKAFALARFMPDGTLDTSFDGDGKVVTDLDPNYFEEALGGALQPDGKILACGRSDVMGGLAVFRYTTNGSLDAGFSGDGMAAVSIINYDERANAIAVRPDGRIVLAGSVLDNVSYDYEVGVVQLQPDGSPDSSFGTNGKVLVAVTTGYDEAFGIVLQDDGKVLVGGYATNSGQYDFLLLRLTTAGELDQGFGSGGVVTTAFGDDADVAYDMVLQPDGRVVLAGFAITGSDVDVALARYEVGGFTGMSDAEPDMMDPRVRPVPLDASSVLTFTLPDPSQVSVELLDAQGRKVFQPLRASTLAQGVHTVPLGAERLAAGSYVVLLRTPEGTRHVKVVR